MVGSLTNQNAWVLGHVGHMEHVGCIGVHRAGTHRTCRAHRTELISNLYFTTLIACCGEPNQSECLVLGCIGHVGVCRGM